MPIRFHCPVCKTAYTVNDEDAGKKSECKNCGQRLQVPAPPDRTKTILGELPPTTPVPTAPPHSWELPAPKSVATDASKQTEASGNEYPNSVAADCGAHNSPLREWHIVGLSAKQAIQLGGILTFAFTCMCCLLPHIANQIHISAGHQAKPSVPVRAMLFIGYAGMLTTPCVTLAILLIFGRQRSGPIWMICIALHVFTVSFSCCIAPLFNLLTIDFRRGLMD